MNVADKAITMIVNLVVWVPIHGYLAMNKFLQLDFINSSSYGID